VERPPGFWAGLGAQWLNPKAWIVALAGITAYSAPGENYRVQVLAMAAVFLVICVPSVGAWAVFGAAARRLMKTERAVRRFNGTMALLLVASIVFLFL
jgi:threonine/homoserine/homoserine lactone efflux protein